MLHTRARDIVPKYAQRTNKEVRKKKYKNYLKAKTEYPISNRVSSHRFFESYALT